MKADANNNVFDQVSQDDERERERERDLYFSVVTGTRYGTKTPSGRQPAN